MESETAAPTGPLKGLKVIDLSRVLGGPFCTQTLGDLGATVIKVEPPQGDETREWGPPFEEDYAAYFAGINRNKRSLALDLSKPEGREVLFRLLEGADVLVENFKPGSMEKWGLGYAEVLEKRFPRLIHAQITGFGGNGPFGGFPGYDAMVQAWSGLISINGSPESGPIRLGSPLVDIGTGLYVAVGILAAVHERTQSGRGQSLEVALYDTGVTLLHPHNANWHMAQVTPKLTGNRHANLVPYQLVPSKGRPVMIGAGNDRQFRTLCRVLGREELADDPRFRTNRDRHANRDTLDPILEELVAPWDGEELAMTLMQNGVPAGAALAVPDVLTHPHTLAREMVVKLDGYQGTGMPIKLSRTPGNVRRAPPRFGAHSAEVLAEFGYDDAEIETMIAHGIVPKEKR
ncbi:CaiB/BaiF CoA transferase family protein [Marinibaculum pumilum]|uniref:CaiB/BaiF CoA transferase family protein n=1 Tax=Marinibaculum pumilum TaxID=1766165 RepID=A0ABV7L383_9PROT